VKEKLIQEYKDKEIYSCELRLSGCNNLFTTFAHRHKRREYRGTNLLWTFNQTILACQNCHTKIEYNRNLSDEMFNKLRGEDDC
jgi:hypothetical protein